MDIEEKDGETYKVSRKKCMIESAAYKDIIYVQQFLFFSQFMT